MTDIRSLFTTLAASLSLPATTTNRALRLFSTYPIPSSSAAVLPQTEFSQDFLCRCALLAASRYFDEGEEKSRPLKLGEVLKDLKDVDMYGFMLHLKSFAEKAELTDTVRKDLTALKANFAFSYIFFKKFEELWSQLLPSPSPDVLKHFCWLLFLICKSELLNNRTDTVDTALMLIGCLHTVVTRLPAGMNTILAGRTQAEALETISEMMKTQSRFSQPFAEKTVKLTQELIHKSVLTAVSDSESLTDLLLREDIVVKNVSALRDYYGQFLGENPVDEREFLVTGAQRRLRVPMTPFVKQGDGVKKWSSQKMQRWDTSAEAHSVTLLTKIEDVKLHQTPGSYPPHETPMTSAMEVHKWLTYLIDSIEFIGVTDILRTYCSQCRPNPENEIIGRVESFKSSFEAAFLQHGISFSGEVKPDRHALSAHQRSVMNPKVEEIMKLYVKMLELMLGSEGRKNAAANFSMILNNDSFHRSLLASCLEAVLFVHNLSSILFEDVLSLANISGFEFWKVITSFCNVDPTMPQQLRAHFRMIEIRIITKLGWVTSSPVHQALKFIAERNRTGITEETTEDEEEEMRSRPLHVTYDLFFKRVLSFTAFRLLTLTEELHIPASLQESIWSSLKYFLSEKTEILLDRHLDQLILCAIFGICKARGHQLKFAQILEQYQKLNYDENQSVARHVRLENGGEGTIIDFYNGVMVAHIKEVATGGRRGESARIESFNPDNSLRSAVSQQLLRSYQQSPNLGKSPFRSPFLTPMTKRLFASQESPITHSSDKRLDFDSEDIRFEPSKRPKHLQSITEPVVNGEILLPVFKKE